MNPPPSNGHRAKSPEITRRTMLASADAMATSWALPRDAVGADHPAVQVEDRASKIKITGFKTFPAGKKCDAPLPQGPGLGVEVDEAALAKLPPTPFNWPGAKHPDGSVADY